MDVNFYLGIALGVCFTMFILFLTRDIFIRRTIDILVESVKVRPMVDLDRFTRVLSSYVNLVNSTVESFNLILDNDVLDKEDRDVITLTRDSLSTNIASTSALLKDLEELSKDE